MPGRRQRGQALAIARKLLTLGESVEKVAELTGVSLGDLQKLQETGEPGPRLRLSAARLGETLGLFIF